MVRETENKGMRLGKYEVGRTLGEGNFGKVKYAKNIETGQPFAVKILEKNKIIDLNITDQVNVILSSCNWVVFHVQSMLDFHG